MPLFAGGLIYLGWRPRSLAMFELADSAGLGSVVDQSRQLVTFGLPDVVLNSRPNALWLY